MTNLDDKDLSKVAAGGGSVDYAQNDQNGNVQKPGGGTLFPVPPPDGGSMPSETENSPDDGGNAQPGLD